MTFFFCWGRARTWKTATPQSRGSCRYVAFGKTNSLSTVRLKKIIFLPSIGENAFCVSCQAQMSEEGGDCVRQRFPFRHSSSCSAARRRHLSGGAALMLLLTRHQMGIQSYDDDSVHLWGDSCRANANSTGFLVNVLGCEMHNVFVSLCFSCPPRKKMNI